MNKELKDYKIKPDEKIENAVIFLHGYGANEEVLFYSQFNESKTPIYHNLFLRYERRVSMKYGNIITYFEFWNAYNRINIETYFWSRDKQDILKTTYFSFIPVGGIEIEF